MKRKYLSPRIMSVGIRPFVSLLSSSIVPDSSPVSWKDAQKDTQCVEINVKREFQIDWDVW
jgi:hypothetical protein